MRPRTLVVLLTLVLGLGAFIWFYERKLPSSEKRAELAKRVFDDLEKDDVTAVTLESDKGQVHLERVAAPEPEKKEEKEEEDEGDVLEPEEPAEWRITRPLTARADSFAVDRLLDSVVTLERSRTLDEVDVKAVGLDKPRATVRLATPDGEKMLKLGAEIPPGGSLVAGLEGEPGAYVVSDALLTELGKEPGEWRDRSMFRGRSEDIQKISLTGTSGTVVLVQRPDGFWIESPVKDRADRDLVNGLFADLSGLTAERFADSQPPAESGLNPPRQIVEVAWKSGGPPVRIELGQVSGELTWARTGGTVFETRTRLAESADRTPADWRALALSAFEVHQIDSATVTDGKTSFKLTRAGTDWKRGDVTISYLPVSDLLSALTGARAERLLAPAEVKLAAPAVTVVLETGEEGQETLTLYPPVAGGVPARAGGRDVILLLPAGTLQEVRGKVREVQVAPAVTSTPPPAP